MGCLGVIENMSALKVSLSEMKFVGPDGNDITNQVLAAVKQAIGNESSEKTICETNIFVSSNTEKNNPHLMSTKFEVPFLGSIPLDPNLLKACDEGESFVENYPSSPAAQSVNDRNWSHSKIVTTLKKNKTWEGGPKTKSQALHKDCDKE